MDGITDRLAYLGLFFVPFLFSLSFHEFAHGWVAYKLGDNTARLMGRLSMNPMAHADILGTLVFPGLAVLLGWPLFGWAKPVPVDTRNLQKPKQDMFWIALAGPLSNVLLAILGAFLLAGVHIYAFGQTGTGGSGSLGATPNAIVEMLKIFLVLNLFLAVFNLIPLHPLDGGKILARFLPPHIERFLEDNQNYVMIFLLLLVFTGGIRLIARPVFFTADLLLNTATQILLLTTGGRRCILTRSEERAPSAAPTLPSSESVGGTAHLGRKQMPVRRAPSAKRIMAGMRPTGPLHIGNYFGALENFIRLQGEHSHCFFGVMDWHAMTESYKEVDSVRAWSREMMAEWVACGLSPQKNVLFIQSHVPEHLELLMIFF